MALEPPITPHPEPNEQEASTKGPYTHASSSRLSVRVVSALALIPPVLFAVFMGGWMFALLVAVGLLVCTIEVTRLARAQGYHILAPWLFVTVTGTLLITQWTIGHPPHGLAVATVMAVILALGSLTGFLWQPDRVVLTDWAVTIGLGVYLIGPGLSAIALRSGAEGRSWLLLALLTTWLCDSGAYFIGRSWGRHPFFHRISPRKTAEGAMGGLLMGMGGGTLAGLLLGVPLSPFIMLLCTATIAVAVEAGDLVESLLKRQANVKDAGTLIPGHGGVLDRVDSLLFAVVVTLLWKLLFS